jgi:hypothetical protein
MKYSKGLFFSTILLSIVLISAPCWGKLDTDIAISTHAGWMGQGTADRESNVIVGNVEGIVNSIEVFPIANEDALATWVEQHTNNNRIDVLILFGQFPAAIYPPGNAEPDDSIAELFLEGGNIIANTGDYMFYVVNGAGTNATGGLQNMMDIPGTSMWDDDTRVEVTEAGERYLPTLKDFNTDRPFHLNELIEPWEVEVIFAGDDTRADPCVVIDTETEGRLAIFYQTASQDSDPRGAVISEFIKNWLPEIVGGTAVEPAGKLGTLWGRLKISN